MRIELIQATGSPCSLRSCPSAGIRKWTRCALGLYLCYQLLVTYLMDQQRVFTQTLLTQPFDQAERESELRHAASGVSQEPK